MQRVHMAAMALNVTETSAITLDHLAEDVIKCTVTGLRCWPSSRL